MLEKLMRETKNYFVKKVYKGSYEIVNGSISLPFLLDGQYFFIKGSVFNDGLHKYPAINLKNEKFCGEIWAQAVPDEFVELANSITDWLKKYDDAVKSPYTSESFGGYSYSKGYGGGYSGSDSGTNGWQKVFRSELNKWRKI